MKSFLRKDETGTLTKNLFFGEFIGTIEGESLADTLRNFESGSIRRAIRNGILLPGAITIIFMSVVSLLFDSSSYFWTGLFVVVSLLFAFSFYATGNPRAFSIMLCFIVLGCTTILSLMNRDTGGVFINGLSLFLLFGSFLFSPRLYYFSLIPVVATIFFQYLDGPYHILGIADPGYSPNEKIALTLLWMTVFVLVTRIIRTNFFTTLKEIVSLNKELESTKESLLLANQNLDELNKSLEDRINERTKALQDALTKAEAAGVAKDRFFATMSHEFRTPLNAIIGYSESISEVLADEFEDAREEVAFSAENVISAGKNLLDLVDDVLEISQLESGRVTLQIMEVKLDQLQQELNVLINPIIKQNHNQFVIINRSQATAIETDHNKLVRILANLLGNAAKFTHEGLVELIISDASEQAVVFEVRDSGVGISADKLEMIFEPFMQAEETNAYSRQYGGVGLGLAISKRLAKDLGGDLAVTSELNTGTCFELIIPKALN